MRRAPIVLAGCLILAACGPQPQGAAVAAQQADAASSGPAPAALVSPPSPQKSAQDFVAKAAGSDAFELAAAQLATQRATDADVKAFAVMMLRDHSKSAADLQQAVDISGQALSGRAAVPPELQRALAELSAAEPTAFDRRYLAGQVKAHEAALALLQDYAQNGDVVSLKAFAAETLPVIQSHYETAEALEAALK